MGQAFPPKEKVMLTVVVQARNGKKVKGELE